MAGVDYQLSAFFVISAVFPMIVAAAVWLPLILLMIEFVIAQRPALRGTPATVIPWIAIGAVALGCCVLAGHVEITYYTLIVAAYYTAARLIYQLWKDRRAAAQRLSPLRMYRRAGLLVAAMLALGMGLGAVQFIPTSKPRRTISARIPPRSSRCSTGRTRRAT